MSPGCPSVRGARRWSALLLTLALTFSLAPGAAALPSSDEVRRDLDRAQQRLDEIDERMSIAVEDYNEAQVALEDVTNRLAASRRELEELQEEQRTLLASVEEHVRRLYKLGPALELSTIMVAGDPNEAGVKSWTMRRILEEQQTDLQRLAANRTNVTVAEQRLEDEQREAEERTERLARARDEVEALFASSEAEVRQLTDLLRRSEAEERRLAEEARLRAAAEAAVAARAAAQASASASGGASDGGPSIPAPATRQSASVAVQAAMAQLGKPYRWGATGPGSFDCSGLTTYAWRAAGVSLPRTSRAQYAGTKRISRDQLQPGDLVFYHSPISHVAMYIGNGQVVEAPNSGNHVRIRSDGLTRRGVVGFGRP